MGFATTGQLSELRDAIGAVVAGERQLRELDEMVATMGEALPAGDDALDRLWGRVELLLAEHGSGVLDDEELRAELAVLAPIPVRIGPAPEWRVTTGAGYRTDQVNLTLREEVPPPVAGRAHVAALV